MPPPCSPKPVPRPRTERAPRGEPAHRAAKRAGAAPPARLLRICGLNAVRALFARDPGRVERLFFEPGLAAELAAECRLAAAAHKPYRAVTAAELARVAGTPRHGGVVAVARRRPLLPLDPAAISGWAADGMPLVILDGVGNPHNLGAIARSAAFFGVARLILADRPQQALPSDESYRVAAGGLDAVTLYRARLPAALDWLKPAYRILGTAPGGGRALAPEPAHRPVALVLGNEETGLDPATLAACDAVATIPGGGPVQSLNVAAAAAVLLYALTLRETAGRAAASSRSSSASSASAASGPASAWRNTNAAASSVDRASRRGSRRSRP